MVWRDRLVGRAHALDVVAGLAIAEGMPKPQRCGVCAVGMRSERRHELCISHRVLDAEGAARRDRKGHKGRLFARAIARRPAVAAAGLVRGGVVRAAEPACGFGALAAQRRAEGVEDTAPAREDQRVQEDEPHDALRDAIHHAADHCPAEAPNASERTRERRCGNRAAVQALRDVASPPLWRVLPALGASAPPQLSDWYLAEVFGQNVLHDVLHEGVQRYLGRQQVPAFAEPRVGGRGDDVPGLAQEVRDGTPAAAAVPRPVHERERERRHRPHRPQRLAAAGLALRARPRKRRGAIARWRRGVARSLALWQPPRSPRCYLSSTNDPTLPLPSGSCTSAQGRRTCQQLRRGRPSQWHVAARCCG
eukprot:scaffold693_cov399-Prasinococcus_capsulatus_cf.AAC.35